MFPGAGTSITYGRGDRCKNSGKNERRWTVLTTPFDSDKFIDPAGELAERLNAPVSKTGRPARVAGVQIPHSPLRSSFCASFAICSDLYLWESGSEVMQEKPSQRYGVFGGYATWAQAAADSDNYQTDLSIYYRICQDIKKGRSSGRNLMPVFAGLGMVNGRANVLDFGGNLGMVYFDVNRIVPDRIASWTVADFPDVCDYGTRHLADGKLNFVTALDALTPDMVVASHMLQYLEHPYRAIESFSALKPKAIVLHEIPLALAEPEFAVQNLITELGGGRRPVQSLDFKSIMQAMPGYSLVSEIVLPDWVPTLRVKQVALLFMSSEAAESKAG